MRRRIWIAAGGAASSWLLAAGYVVVNEGCGSGDLVAFAFWCALFAAFLAATSVTVVGLIPPRNRPARTAWGLLAGGLIGVGFTFIAYLSLGPWILAFSFPAGLTWILGGAVAGGAIGLAAAPHEGRSVAGMVARLGLAAIAVAALPLLLVLGDVFVWGRAVHTRYLLPPDFLGPVVLVYGVPDAAPLVRDKDGYLISVPSSGVVLTSTGPNDGWRDPDVFYDRNGTLTAVTTDWPGQNDTLRGVRTYWLSNRGRLTLNGVPQPYLDYEAFAVSTSQYDEEVRGRAEVLIDSLEALYAR